MITPGRHDFTAYVGATFNESVDWVDGAGVVVDLNGYAARMEIRDAQGVLLAALDSGLAGGIAPQPDKTIRLWVDDDVTRTWPPGTYAYDLLLRELTGNLVFPLLRGKFAVKALVTTGEPGGDVA